MTELGPYVRGILAPLSTILQKKLTLGGTPAEPVVEVPGTESLSMEERELVSRMTNLLQMCAAKEIGFRTLQHQLREIERDNIELRTNNRMLAEISARDSLTGLYNRWYVIDKIEAELNRSLRHGSPMALLMLDLDHFKRINDTYGHPAGDIVLKAVARLLKESCRVYDVPGRYGGEEFCILLPETKLDQTPVVAERIRQRLEMTELAVGDSALIVTASIGVAAVDSGAEEPVLSPMALIDRADRAMYSAKHGGRNRVALWDASLQKARPIEGIGH